MNNASDRVIRLVIHRAYINMRVRQIQPKLRDFNKAGLMAYLLFFAAAKRHGLGFAVIFTVQGKKHDAIIDRDTDLIFLAPNPRFQIIIADTDTA